MARRDHGKYQALIKSIALLHQMQRPVREKIRDGCTLRYIEATWRDVALATDLAHRILGRQVGDLSAPAQDLLGLCEKFVAKRAREEAIDPESVRFSRRDIREATGWSHYQVKTYIRQLVELEYLVPVSGNSGGGRYV